MANFSTLRVKSAVKGRSKNDLNSTHLTTMDIGQIVPLWAEEAIPGAEYLVSANFFSRMAPLVKPTYGKFYFKTLEAFVPYYQVCDDIDAWMAGRQNHEGDYTTSRFLSRASLISLFSDSSLSSSVSSSDVSNGAWYDFTFVNSSGTTVYYALNNKGRYYLKVLNSLGYSIPQNADMRPASSWYSNYGSEGLSALPLLAFAKAYNDWMSQSQRFNSSILSKLLKNIRHNVTTTVSGTTLYNASNNRLSAAGIDNILSAVKLCYENDYFTSAWQYPNAPITGEYYDPEKSSPNAGEISKALLNSENGTLYTGTQNQVYNPTFDINGVVDSEGVVATDGTITIAQRSLDILQAFDNWVRRNNYSGSRSVQQVYSRFGIKTADYKSNYAHLIDTSVMPIQVGDVTAVAQDYVSSGSANNVELGDYAGKGIMSGQTGFKFKCNDYGLLVVLGWYTVAPMNVYGEDKKVLRNTPLDYYNPEFDGITMEPISVGEVFVNPRITTTVQSNAVFGFTEKYNSYRFGKDRITGDFRKMPSLDASHGLDGTEMNTWHTGRILNSLLNAGTLVAQNPDFSTLPQTNSEYNRIFSVTDGSVDHFYMTAQFKVSAVLPILSLNQVPRLGEGDTVLPRNGNEIN